MTVKRRLSQFLGSLRLKRKKVVELSIGKSLSQSKSQLLEDRDTAGAWEECGRENYYLENNAEENDSPIVLFAELRVELVPETTYASPANKSGNNPMHPASAPPCQNTNSKRRGDDKKIEHYYDGPESIPGEIAGLTEATQSTQPPTSEPKLKRRLSVKGLKKSGKGMLKTLQTGFVAMGNTNTMLQASLGSPIAYELASAMGDYSNRDREWDCKLSSYDNEYERTRNQYVEFYSRKQQECGKVNTKYDW